VEEAIIARLLGDAGVLALVSNRVFPVSRPQASTLPAVTVTRISGAPIMDDGGEAGLLDARIQIDCWGETYSSAKLLARAVLTSLSGFRGTVGATEFENVELDTERDSREGGGNAEAYEFRTSLDFFVWSRR
jgi:hypothetical protein